MYSVGWALMAGDGADKDTVEAAQWFQKAADKGTMLRSHTNTKSGSGWETVWR